MAPAGAGKSTIAKKVAASLGYAYIDTGAMYRAVTLSCLTAGLSLTESAATQMAQGIKISFRYEDGRNQVYLNDHEVTDAIRSLEVSGMFHRSVPMAAFAQQWLLSSGRWEKTVGLSWMDVILARSSFRMPSLRSF